MLKERFKKENFIKNIPLVISGGIFALISSAGFMGLINAAIVIAVLFICAFFITDAFSFWKSNLSAFNSLVAVGILCFSGYNLYLLITKNLFLREIFDGANINIAVIAIIAGLILSAASFYFLTLFIEYILKKAEYCFEFIPQKGNIVSLIAKKEFLFIFITAVITMTICTKSSPIYPLNDWVDANCFLTVGKSMLYGKVPYRDLFEQKGPLLYIIHALAATVSQTSFLGVYFIEIIACTVFLYFSFKIARLYSENANILLVPVLAVIVYTSRSFCHGDSAEELCLPLITYCIYVGLKMLNGDLQLKNRECYMLGLTAGCVLWIKFSMLGFYLGFIIVPAVLLIKEKRFGNLFKMLIFIALGVLTVTIPILIYFAANNSLYDLWTVYFYNNIFHYSSTSSDSIFLLSLMRNILEGLKHILAFNFIPAILMAFSIILLFNKKGKREFWFILSSLMGMVFLVYIGGRRYLYYSFIFSAFVPLGITLISNIIELILRKIKFSKFSENGFKAAIVISLFLIAFVMSENTKLLKYKKEDMPQYQFAKIISEVENATLLNYEFLDGGFYTTAGIVPNCRYFCYLNIAMPEIMQTQNEYIENGRVDFVVTCDREIDSQLYECVSLSSMPFEGADRKYRLYRLKTI